MAFEFSQSLICLQAALVQFCAGDWECLSYITHGMFLSKMFLVIVIDAKLLAGITDYALYLHR